MMTNAHNCDNGVIIPTHFKNSAKTSEVYTRYNDYSLSPLRLLGYGGHAHRTAVSDDEYSALSQPPSYGLLLEQLRSRSITHTFSNPYYNLPINILHYT